MKKLIFILLVAFIIASCTKIDEKEWTILIYMAADNSLSGDPNPALVDLVDMQSAEFSDEINLIVQIDQDQNSANSGATRYRIYPGTKQQISYLGEIDSGEAANLTAFANWGFSQYPAQKHALFIWGHGNGWYSDANAGFCSDDESDSFISIADGEFAEAVENIAQHLDILVMDACNMQTMEVANEVYEYCDFIIAAEDGINNLGFPYQEIFSHWQDHTEVEFIAKQIAHEFHKFYWSEDLYPISCSVIKTAEFPSLLTKLTEFTDQWGNSVDHDLFSQARENCLEFNPTFSINPAMDIDLKEFFVNTIDESILNANNELTVFCQDMIVLVDSCFIMQLSDDYPSGYSSENVGTALIWYPDQETQGFFDLRKDQYEDLRFFETGWLNFLENAYQK